MKTKKTSDSYEASYYLMFGARVTKVRQKLISKHQRDKRGFSKQWIIYLEEIPTWAHLGWQHGITYGSIQSFKKARLNLKRLIANSH